ncbi:DUF2938 domain-containing protein [Iodobacter sp. HSC-16F04]|uniref:DUF2938 domain-containing protein n=1 Tax=Iodobacter violaceini TaxID=3044271 RepID=A0ABX0KMB7_9NEIS|nr:DUF2938 domain-containing protein [Iodobacter violacea]NHQ85448.1 DUF2938 domain-containing protein [Iodobacter violacea]
MSTESAIILKIILTGLGATLLMDLWALLLKRFLNIQSLDWAMAGRWIGHMRSGHFRHDSIAKASPIKWELQIGWLAHYATGVFFAALLTTIAGPEWLTQPVALTTILFGIATVVFPFFMMQPGMGAGLAASKTPNPKQARLRSLITHTVFGVGLYGAALGLSFLRA